ncbi:MAG: hypothetical protein K0S09_2174 [Sphingobacteriaceae bacterium]|jgi:hypothetical protein|nr:hypothetical protein [Sphingobacteriaceae bacterium]
MQCDTADILETRMAYLHENPVRAGIVRYEQDYIYSSGIDYHGNSKGLIELITPVYALIRRALRNSTDR